MAARPDPVRGITRHPRSTACCWCTSRSSWGVHREAKHDLAARLTDVMSLAKQVLTRQIADALATAEHNVRLL